MKAEKLKIWLEGALLAAGQPLTLTQINSLFDEGEQPGHGAIREALALLDAELSDRAIELVEVAGGYRLQIRQPLMPILSRLWAEKPPRYSRALLETLAIIAYRQPITRSEIEQIRGVSLSANILKTLQEREWIKVVGHRDIPGKPELLGTTKVFLDYFALKGLDNLPTLAEIRDLDNIEPELGLNDPDHVQAANDDKQEDARQDQQQAEQDNVEHVPKDDTEGSQDKRHEENIEQGIEQSVERSAGDDEGRQGPEEAPEPEESDDADAGQQRTPAGGGAG